MLNEQIEVRVFKIQLKKEKERNRDTERLLCPGGPHRSRFQFHLCEAPRVVKFTETESRMVVARGWGEGEMRK